jgi:hypothetical protein
MLSSVAFFIWKPWEGFHNLRLPPNGLRLLLPFENIELPFERPA